MASVVSIMIIMVVMVGMRIKNAPVQVAIPASPASPELEKDLAAEQSLRGDIVKMTADIRGLQHEVAVRGTQRDILATLASAAEHEIHQRRQKLDGIQRANFDLARGLSESRFQLDHLAHERQEAENAPGEQVVVESYPTPISREVDGPEAHLLISHGRVVVVPMESLVEQLRTQARRQASKLSDQPELSDSIGPVEGFRLNYTLERYDVAPDGPRGTGHGGSYVRLQRFTLVPIADDLGEPRADWRSNKVRIFGRCWPRYCRAARPIPSGFIPMDLTPFARFARNCIGSATGLPPAPCPQANPSAARRTGPSRRHNSALVPSGPPGELQSPGTGPFFGEKSQFSGQTAVRKHRTCPLRVRLLLCRRVSTGRPAIYSLPVVSGQ